MIWVGIILGIFICSIGAVVFWFYIDKEITKDELNESRDKYNKLVHRFNGVNQKLHLYDYLLYDANAVLKTLLISYMKEPTEDTLEDINVCLNQLFDIAEEYEALQNKKTIGYYYSGNKEEDARLLEGYELLEHEDLAPEPTITIDEDE